jgi:predicted house-cleaning noncanonical NTP pyrophosphatase (MazG superfamily)
MKVYNKLVRDKIPDIIRRSGKRCSFHTATEEEYLIRLKDKLFEELQELYEEPSIEELADVLEVVYALGRRLNLNVVDSYGAMTKKGISKGKFRDKIILEMVEE